MLWFIGFIGFILVVLAISTGLGLIAAVLQLILVLRSKRRE